MCERETEREREREKNGEDIMGNSFQMETLETVCLSVDPTAHALSFSCYGLTCLAEKGTIFTWFSYIVSYFHKCASSILTIVLVIFKFYFFDN